MRFTVYGAAKPKGAVRPIPIKRGGVVIGSRLTDDGSASRPWAALVQDAARQHRRQVGADEHAVMFSADVAVSVELTFRLPRPKSLPKRTPSAPLGARSGDIDKLTRAVLDALTGIIWHDDAQVAHLVATKAYAEPNGAPRLDVAVAPVNLAVGVFADSIRPLPTGDRP